MSVRARRRRGLILIALAVAAGGLAAWEVEKRTSRAEAQVGPGLPVVVAEKNLRAGVRMNADTVRTGLVVRNVPERFVPPDSFASPDEILGARTAVPLVAGSYVTAGQLEASDPRDLAGPPLAEGERVVQIAVVTDPAGLSPGARVDVVISTESSGSDVSGRTYVALQDVELVDLKTQVHGEQLNAPARAVGQSLASLRVTVDQAVLLTAAQNFGREIRLLARPPGDRRRIRPTAVDGDEL
jgi:pilus assembly protein CpaB